jgi:peptidoglycan/xylan/chitin deacetylase (PgdA/CDA1 family)
MKKNNLFWKISSTKTTNIFTTAIIIFLSACISILVISIRELKTTNLLADATTTLGKANPQALSPSVGTGINSDETSKQEYIEEDPINKVPIVSEIPPQDIVPIIPEIPSLIKETIVSSPVKNIIAAEEVFTFGRNQGKKYAFLTFDDGPNKKITPKILSILKEHNISATFFVLGGAVESNPLLVKQIYSDGHAIANHTYSHNYKVLYPNKTVNVQAFMEEVEKTTAAIVNIIGTSSSSRVVRFPSGSFEAWKKPMREELTKAGLYYVDWNAENRDGVKNDVSIEEQLEAIADNIANSEGSNTNLIVLMHDSSTKQSTVDALPDIIGLIKSKGYEFATIK